MIVAFDVDYRDHAVVAAAVGFSDWPAATPTFETKTAFPPNAKSYQPGQFYRREMPYLQALLAILPDVPDVIVVDGYVWLDAGRPGLGAHLHEALGGKTPVIGVAKRAFRNGSNAIAITRGTSLAPLFVTAIGTDALDAARGIEQMHGPHRMPTMLKLVDQLSRSSV